MNRLHALAEEGQAVWLDNIARSLLDGGGLEKLVVRDGIRGVTSNPSIFHKAISSGNEYDSALGALLLASPDIGTKELYEELAVADIRDAADVLHKVWDRTRGEDGYVSLEVSPHLAHDTDGTVNEARRLWRMVDRPNLMIKVPATPAGIPAIETLLAEGLNINITLMFSLEDYEQVAGAYLRGLQRASDPKRIASVASFFISRVDSMVDQQLEQIGTPEALALRGRAAIANARLAYRRFTEIFEGGAFESLQRRGARVQRPLWASTSTKNPAYRDVLYVEQLVGRHTVNTLPPATVDAFRDHGETAETLRSGFEDAEQVLEGLQGVGIDLDAVTAELQRAGVEAFAKAFDALLADLEEKRRGLDIEGLPTGLYQIGALSDRVANRLSEWRRNGFARRLWKRDPTLWGTENTPELADRLGWLQLPETQRSQGEALTGLVRELRQDRIRRVVLLGMGGSSLAPEVFQETFGTAPDHPELLVLDSTHPDAVQAVRESLELENTLFLVASKSGTTLESRSLMIYFWGELETRVDSPGRHFMAITDPGSSLEQEAMDRGFRSLFLAPPDVGGRFSALSPFGIVPAALIGVDVARLLDRAWEMAIACGRLVPEGRNPGLRLGAALAEAAAAGRDKLTFVVDDRLAAFPAWIEQLVAESTGKEGRGILPVSEPLARLESYGADRLFVVLGVPPAEPIDSLRQAGHPVIQIPTLDPYEIGAEMFRWEVATTAAGSALGIHPFDQPDVELAKQLARQALDAPAVAPTEISVADSETLARTLEGWLEGIESGDYLAIQAYLARTEGCDRLLERLQGLLCDRLGVAVTVGYGPRYLHSTGQLHKGGPPSGHFLQLVDRPRCSLSVPGSSATFNEILEAQATGDFRALEEKGRRVLRVQLGDRPSEGLEALLAPLAL